MKQIDEYMALPQEQRKKHINLSEACIERGGPTNRVSTYCKGLLAHLLDTTIPSGMKVYVCHACNNGLCSNPNHLYWGTASENCIDRQNNGAKSCWEYTVLKHGYDEAMKIRSRRKGVKLKVYCGQDKR